MNRKLQTTAYAAALATATLVFGVSAFQPAVQAPVAAATATVSAARPVVAVAAHQVAKAKRIRRSMAMPFFSFVARG